MIKFELPNNYYIKKVDNRNFALCKMGINKKTKEPTEIVEGYAYDLPGAWRLAVRKISLSAESNKELYDLVERLEKLKPLTK